MPSEVDVSFSWNGLELAGSLHLPDGGGPFPAVVMAQGSGDADRDSGGYFQQIRRAFLDQGIGAFAFDKPGCGQSSGHWRDYSLDARTDQLTTALQIVREHPSINGERVGVFGHSQGGWLVQKLAGLPGPLAFAVASSAPSISVREQILYEIEQRMPERGHNEAQTSEALSLAQALQEAAGEGASFETIRSRFFEPAKSRPWFKDFPEIEGPEDWQFFVHTINEAHDPIADMHRISSPFLAVYGGLDTLLPPWQGASESGRALGTASSLSTAVVVFPTGDHRLQIENRTRFTPGYLDLLGDWCAAQLR